MLPSGLTCSHAPRLYGLIVIGKIGLLATSGKMPAPLRGVTGSRPARIQIFFRGLGRKKTRKAW